MRLEAFKNLPDAARLWIYAFDKPLSEDDVRMISDRLAAFMEDWHSHNVNVEGAFSILHDRFVILSAVSRDGISGCSIDRSVDNFKYFRDHCGLDGLKRDLVHYRDGSGDIRTLDRAGFRAEVDAGRCGPKTPVFNITVETLGALRAGRFEVPLEDSWHAEIFLSR